MTIFHQAVAAVVQLLLTLWLQSVGMAAATVWLKRLMARGIHKFWSFRAAALLVQSTVPWIVLPGFDHLCCFPSLAAIRISFLPSIAHDPWR
jgi:hypothetical protein